MEEQLDLWGTERRLPDTSDFPPGCRYIPAFLTRERCSDLLASIDQREWLHDLKRRVQHYGWKYDYKSRVTADMRIGDLPTFLRDLASRLHKEGWFDTQPDQVIVNEYLPGQGIAAHVDRDCFGPTVATLSLGDAWPMEFAPYRPRGGQRTDPAEKREKIECRLDVGSLLVLTDEARDEWTHGIAARKKDAGRPRERRVSVTFRTVVRPA